ncbi:alpha/beta hydrolase family protein [Hymenobacter weizhouensis]|uniref:alpha/beta hydrolase family protein n=1 Tax=Hymenobacter sp. YIM 151500-1 TaxID=2987689 RepID=UPI002227865B|nr:alpha/beta fold hydrolase [Hymenobacter sp. YIM 151500-1]UYZ61795.1 alpha/beta fold hydrolase [Hymenobacter sp. YIM 151500-1]
MKKTLLVLWWIVLLAVTSFHSWATPRRADDPPAALNGQWKGPLKVPGGELTLIITLVPLSNGSYYAALDAPQQRISRMPAEVEVKGNDITLRIEQAGSRFVGKVKDGGATFDGTWTQPGMSVPLTLRRASAPAMANGKVRLTPPYREEEVVFTNAAAKIRLAGTLTIPAGPGPFPAVALLSDSGPQDRDAEQQDYRMFGMLADHLTRRGIAVLRFDDRGVGKSQGNYLTATTADLVADAQAAMSFLRARNLVDPQQIGLIGHGEGANVALLAAADHAPAKPAFVVSLAGYGLPGREVLVRQQVEIMRLIGANPAQVKAALDLHDRMINIIRQTPNDAQARGKVAAALRLNNTDIDPQMARARAAQLTSPWSRYFLDFDPVRKLSNVKCPVLLLSGTADLQVDPAQHMAPLKRGLKHSNVTADRLSGINHWFQPDPQDWPLVNGVQQPTFAPKALDVVREWVFENTTRPQPLPITEKRPKPVKGARKSTKTAQASR